MANINTAFQPEDGINFDDLVGIFAGTTDPSSVGEVAPIGSLFIRNTGNLYQKIGSGNFDWLAFSSGAPTVKVSSNDTTAGYLTQKLLIGAYLSKSVDNPTANETITIDLAAIGTAGTYTQVTTNSRGQVISGSNPGFITTNQNITLSGDVTGSGNTAITTTLSNTGITPGTYRSVTFDSKGRATSGTNPTTLAEYGITDAQPLDADLTALAALASTGIVTRTAADTYALRTITGTTSRISVSNGSGVSGNPTLDIDTAYVGQSSITTLGTITTGTWTGTTIAAANGGTGQSTYTIGDLLYANSTTTLTKLPAVSTGNALISGGVSSAPAWGKIDLTTHISGVLGIANGGTNLSSLGTANQLLGVNTGGTGLEYKTATAGAGIQITNSAGAVTVASLAALPGSGHLGKLYSATISPQSGTSLILTTATPTTSDGWQLATVTLTPVSTSSKFLINCVIYVDLGSNNHNVQIAVFRGSTCIGSSSITVATSGRPQLLGVQLLDSPATTSSTTYSIRAGMDASGTTYVNQDKDGNTQGGTAKSEFTVIEVR